MYLCEQFKNISPKGKMYLCEKLENISPVGKLYLSVQEKK